MAKKTKSPAEKVTKTKKTSMAPITTQAEKNSLTMNINKIFDTKQKKLLGLGAILLIALAVLLFIFKSVFIASIVNGQPISRLSVVRELEKQGGKATLDSLTTEILIRQEAKKRGVNIDQKEIDTELKNIETQVKSQGTDLETALSSRGMTRTQLIDQIRVQKLLEKMAGENTKASEKEIDEFITANKTQFPAEMTEAEQRKAASEQITQQNKQLATENFLKSLQDKAKIYRFTY